VCNRASSLPARKKDRASGDHYMAVVRRLRIETQNALWSVAVTDRPDGYRCDFFGTTPKYARAMGPGVKAPAMSDMGRGTRLGQDVDKLLAEARSRIEAIDGPITREF